MHVVVEVLLAQHGHCKLNVPVKQSRWPCKGCYLVIILKKLLLLFTSSRPLCVKISNSIWIYMWGMSSHHLSNMPLDPLPDDKLPFWCGLPCCLNQTLVWAWLPTKLSSTCTWLPASQRVRSQFAQRAEQGLTDEPSLEVWCDGEYAGDSQFGLKLVWCNSPNSLATT